jgi:hypothetical protein
MSDNQGSLTLEVSKCVEEDKATLVATKIVCEDERYLPNWGAIKADGNPITANSAQNFLDSVNTGEEDVCWLASDWEFEWAPLGTTNPGDDYIGYGGGQWSTFGPTDQNGSVQLSIDLNQLGTGLFFREVLKDEYIPFADEFGDSDISAEFYCHTDVLNYDNLDQITGMEEGETYYCLGFNALKKIDDEGISPILECVEELGRGEYRAHFGYETHNTTDVTVPIGSQNKFTGGGVVGEDQGQPTLFEYPAPNYPSPSRMGRTGFYPNNPFFVDFDGTNLVWTLQGPDGNTKTSTASINSKKCPVEEETFNLVAHKVVCETEADLPDWAESQNQPSEITQSLIVNYVNNSHGACYFEEDWEFEWAEEGTQKKPGAFTGQAGTGWTTFGPTTSGPTGMATTTIDYEDRDMIWVREVLKNGYIPFSDQNGGSESTSAELLCSIDGYNYDNYDRVDDPEVGETYYCVGFNVAEEGNNHTPRTSSGGGITLLQIKEEDEETPESDQPEESTPSENEEESEAPEDFIEGEILGSFIQRYQANKKCGPYLNEYIKAGAKNNPLEVLKLQLFLRDYLGINLPLNGIYGKDTVAALEEFQLMHKDEVLKPWVEAGVHENENTPTGYVYLTTQRWINMIMCPSLNLPKIDLSEYTAEVLLSPKLNINFDDMDSKEPEEGVEEIEVGSVEEDSNGLELLAGTVNDSETPTRLGTLLLAFLFVSIAGFMGYKAYHHHLVKR